MTAKAKADQCRAQIHKLLCSLGETSLHRSHHASHPSFASIPVTGIRFINSYVVYEPIYNRPHTSHSSAPNDLCVRAMSAGKSLTGMKRDKVAAVDEPVRRQRGAERPALSAGGTLRLST